MQIASEESYIDMTDLQSKLQMHQAFEAELASNQERVDSVQRVRVSMFVCVSESQYVSVNVCLCVCVSESQYVSVNVCLCVCVYLSLSMCLSVNVCLCVCI